jgi:hypothetical protein
MSYVSSSEGPEHEPFRGAPAPLRAGPHQSPPELATPPLFMVFDCLYARGKDLRSQQRLPAGASPVRDLDGGVEGEHVWMTCDCGAAIVQPVPPDAPDR